jgi:hypothetical protein
MSINDRPPVKRQPKPGETILHCEHLTRQGEGGPPAKFFRIRRENPPIGVSPFVGIPFTRPSGSKGTATIIGLCMNCWRGSGGVLAKVKLCKDSTWLSEAPVVRESPENVKQGE